MTASVATEMIKIESYNKRIIYKSPASFKKIIFWQFEKVVITMQ